MGAHGDHISIGRDARSISLARRTASNSATAGIGAIDRHRPPTHSRRIAIGFSESNP
jgi:hypothetical protein